MNWRSILRWGEKGTFVFHLWTHLSPPSMPCSYPFFTSCSFCLLHALDYFHIFFHISIKCPNWEFPSPCVFLLSLCNWWRRRHAASKGLSLHFGYKHLQRSGIEKKLNLTRNSCVHFIYIHSNRAHSRLFHLVRHPDAGCYGCFDGFFAIKRFCRDWCFWQ